VQGLSKSRPKNYPESFFGRLPLPKELVRLCIGRLQSDDVYLASTAFPNPDQRSTALAGQVGTHTGQERIDSVTRDWEREEWN
jgi:hypothetical protein